MARPFSAGSWVHVASNATPVPLSQHPRQPTGTSQPVWYSESPVRSVTVRAESTSPSIVPRRLRSLRPTVRLSTWPGFPVIGKWMPALSVMRGEIRAQMFPHCRSRPAACLTIFCLFPNPPRTPMWMCMVAPCSSWSEAAVSNPAQP